jgi:hypothetical protein
MTRVLLAVGVLLGVSLIATAQDVDSGPKKGEKVPALKVYDATGENKEKTVDYVGLRKDKPTVYLFIGSGDDAKGKFDRPMNQFIKTLDGVIEKDLEDVYAVAVFLTEDEDKTREFLPKAQESVKYEKTAMATFKGKDGPKDWSINSDAHLTVIIAHKGKVTARFGYNSVNDTDVRAVMKELKKVAKEKKKD